jgi:hypothetical protein
MHVLAHGRERSGAEIPELIACVCVCEKEPTKGAPTRQLKGEGWPWGVSSSGRNKARQRHPPRQVRSRPKWEMKLPGKLAEGGMEVTLVLWARMRHVFVLVLVLSYGTSTLQAVGACLPCVIALLVRPPRLWKSCARTDGTYVR